MQHAKILILIPPETLHHYQTISNLDDETKQILNNRSMSVEEKWVQYREVLQKYLHIVQKPHPQQLRREMMMMIYYLLSPNFVCVKQIKTQIKTKFQHSV